jgi:hypothetical protein
MTPHLVKWHERFGPDRLVVLEIDDGNTDTLDAVGEWAAKEKLPYLVLHDKDGVTCARYGVRGYPSMYLIARGGEVVWEGHGYSNDTPATVEQAIRKQLDAPGKRTT